MSDQNLKKPNKVKKIMLWYIEKLKTKKAVLIAIWIVAILILWLYIPTFIRVADDYVNWYNQWDIQMLYDQATDVSSQAKILFTRMKEIDKKIIDMEAQIEDMKWDKTEIYDEYMTLREDYTRILVEIENINTKTLYNLPE